MDCRRRRTHRSPPCGTLEERLAVVIQRRTGQPSHRKQTSHTVLDAPPPLNRLPPLLGPLRPGPSGLAAIRRCERVHGDPGQAGRVPPPPRDAGGVGRRQRADKRALLRHRRGEPASGSPLSVGGRHRRGFPAWRPPGNARRPAPAAWHAQHFEARFLRPKCRRIRRPRRTRVPRDRSRARGPCLSNRPGGGPRRAVI